MRCTFRWSSLPNSMDTFLNVSFQRQCKNTTVNISFSIFTLKGSHRKILHSLGFVESAL